ncbi:MULTISPECIES: hypothetical protein [Sphingobacterium]|uniref:hypothetical protein n=1 Tax=Sphingobacterium TaxID=28453 RepID=UPI0013D93668|nr:MULTISPECIES: hypothetical protein [unclassified Sphingobacterium]
MCQDLQIEGRLAISKSWKQPVGRDSFSRYWKFIRDTGLYFHPDEGMGQSRKIAYIEQKSVEVKQSECKTSWDSLGIKK